MCDEQSSIELTGEVVKCQVPSTETVDDRENIDHKKMMRFLAERTSDQAFLRLLTHLESICPETDVQSVAKNPSGLRAD